MVDGTTCDTCCRSNILGRHRVYVTMYDMLLTLSTASSPIQFTSFNINVHTIDLVYLIFDQIVAVRLYFTIVNVSETKMVANIERLNIML